MQLYIPLHEVYKEKYGKEQHMTLIDYQNYIMDHRYHGDYDGIVRMLNEYMQDDLDKAATMVHQELKKQFPNLTHRELLEDTEYANHLETGMLRAIEDGWRNDYTDKYTQAFKNMAIKNLEDVLGAKELDVNYSRIALHREKSEYNEALTTPIKDLCYLRGDDHPGELWDATDIVITINETEAKRIIDEHGYHSYDSKTTNDELCDLALDAIRDVLSCYEVNTEYIDYYGTLGDYDNWEEPFTDYHMSEVVDNITASIQRRNKEYSAATAVYDAIHNSVLLDSVKTHYDGDKEPIIFTHNGETFALTITKQ